MFFRIYLCLIVLHCYSVHADRDEPPNKRCGINQVWDCDVSPPPTCNDEKCDGPHACPLDPEGNCKEACVCEPGFVRKGCKGPCTYFKQCSSQGPDDCHHDEEYQECGTFCPETCANRGQSRPCTRQCVQGCFCKPGLVRDIDGSCVDPKQCPGKGDGGDDGDDGDDCSDRDDCVDCCDDDDDDICEHDDDDGEKNAPTCRMNQTYSLKPVICPPETCDAIGKTFHCPINSTSNTPACVCKSGYFRNKDKKCVLKADCDSCGGDPNARPGCGNPCGRRCADIGKPIPFCPAFCLPNGCDCIEGYFLDENNKCVLPCDCTRS